MSSRTPALPGRVRIVAQRTGGILAAADLDEGLDIRNFLRHDGRLGVDVRWLGTWYRRRSVTNWRCGRPSPRNCYAKSSRAAADPVFRCPRRSRSTSTSLRLCSLLTTPCQGSSRLYPPWQRR